MTLKESYQSAYDAKNKALKAQYNVKTKVLEEEKKSHRDKGAEQLRQAYATFLRSMASAEQTNRAAGRWGGAAQNQKAGAVMTHKQAQAEKRSQTADKMASVDQEITTQRAALDKQLSDNQTALQQKLDNLAIKEQQAAAKAKEKAEKEAAKAKEKAEKEAAKSSKSSSKSSSKATTKSQVLSMLRMGIYDASFAGILGVSDSEVRQYIKDYQKKKSSSTKKSSALDENGRLPGTYKPPLK